MRLVSKNCKLCRHHSSHVLSVTIPGILPECQPALEYRGFLVIECLGKIQLRKEWRTTGKWPSNQSIAATLPVRYSINTTLVHGSLGILRLLFTKNMLAKVVLAAGVFVSGVLAQSTGALYGQVCDVLSMNLYE
jgi:hypothetical protein